MNTLRIRAPLLALSVPLFLAACAETTFDDSVSRLLYKDATPASIAVQAAETITLDQLSPDAQLALRAVVLRLHGNDAAAVDAAVGLSGSAAAQPEPDFTYDGFTVRALKRVAQSDGSFHVLLRFEDQAGRTAAAAIAARYARSANGLALTQVEYRPLFPAHPEVELLIMPAEKMDAGFTDAALTYAGLRAFVEAHAVPMRSPDAVDRAQRDYIAFAFLKDRIAGEAKIAMRLSDQRLGTQGFDRDTRYLAFEPGWGAAATGGAFALAPDRAFWIKVAYDPKGSVAGAGSGERVIGLFSTAPIAAAAE